MGKFTEPFANTKMEKKNLSKTVEIDTYKFANLHSPYGGEIIVVTPNECNGKLKLKHQVDGRIIYTEFCGVLSNLPTGGRVSQGEKIGKAKDDTVEMKIYDGNMREISHTPFFIDVNTTTDDSMDKKKNNKKIKVDNEVGTDKLVLWNFFNDMMGKPIDLLHKVNPLSKQAWTGKKESTEEKNSVIEEEINRIKKLL